MSIKYTYDADGRRLTKTGPLQESHQYVYNGDKLIEETVSKKFEAAKTITYLYSGNEIIGFVYDNASYLFIKNLQRDIIAIVDSTGNIVAKYVYDAWGNHIVCNPDGTTNTTVSFIGNINPFRYRGYYYDTESGLYWCKSRYYNPEWGRWLSPDSTEYLDSSSINGLNLYAYCGNNPVNMYDPSGEFFKKIFSQKTNVSSEWIGSTIVHEDTFITEYFFWFEYQAGKGESVSDGKEVNFLYIVPSQWWKIWEYSSGFDFHGKYYGFQIFSGTERGFGMYNDYGGCSISFDISGRLKFTTTKNVPNTNDYIIESVVINTHNIFGTLVVLYFLPALVPVAATFAAQVVNYA